MSILITDQTLILEYILEYCIFIEKKHQML